MCHVAEPRALPLASGAAPAEPAWRTGRAAHACGDRPGAAPLQLGPAVWPMCLAPEPDPVSLAGGHLLHAGVGMGSMEAQPLGPVAPALRPDVQPAHSDRAGVIL